MAFERLKKFGKSVGAKVCSAASKVTGAIGMKKASNWFGEKADKLSGKMKETADKTAKDIGEADEMDYDTASVSQIDRMAELLSSVSVQYKEEARQIEEEIVDDINTAFDEISDALADEDIETGFIKTKQRNIRKSVKNKIVDEISENLSLGNSEVENILSMRSGSAKENKMRRYCYGVISDAVEAFSGSLRSSCGKVADTIENTVNEKIDEEQTALSAKEAELENLISQKNDESFDKEQASIEPLNNINVCNYILDLLANDN